MDHAAGAVLDATSLSLSSLDQLNPAPQLGIRAGSCACAEGSRGYFDIHYDPDPRPDDPISIGRDEFDDLCEAIAAGSRAGPRP